MSRAIRRSPDVRRMAAAVSHPGIDPRTWLSWAIVTAIGFDAEQGIFADVQLIPTGETETIYVGSDYAGGGFGDWAGVEIDDTVCIGFPNGDPNSGGVLISRTWNGGDPPPAVLQEGEAPTKDRVLVVKPGQKWRVIVSQGGEASIENGSTTLTMKHSEVLIGDTTAQPLALGAALQQLITGLQAFTKATKLAVIEPALAPAATALESAMLGIIKVQTTKAKGT